MARDFIGCKFCTDHTGMFCSKKVGDWIEVCDTDNMVEQMSFYYIVEHLKLIACSNKKESASCSVEWSVWIFQRCTCTGKDRHIPIVVSMVQVG